MKQLEIFDLAVPTSISSRTISMAKKNFWVLTVVILFILTTPLAIKAVYCSVAMFEDILALKICYFTKNVNTDGLLH